jgi:CubicO group peptidase (beta-lactamase class C family)
MRINFNSINQFIVLIALCLFIFQSVSAQNPAASSAQQIAAKVDEYMNAAVKVDGFSGSVLVARDGQPIISKGYGMANLELDVPNTPQTVFSIGTYTANFTGMAVMMLQERGKLNLNDSICKHLPDCSSAWQPITVRHLLAQTSGIPNFTFSPDFEQTMALPVTQAVMIERLKSKPLEFAPGEKFNASNSGYYLLGVIVEKVSGKSYADFVRENIFAPLEMKNTDYDDRRIVKNRASGYSIINDKLTNALYVAPSVFFSAGAVYSTTEDLLRWDNALYTEKLVSRKTIEEINAFGRAAGYGDKVTQLFNHPIIRYTGGTYGFRSHLTRFPDDRMVIIILTNHGFGKEDKFIRDIAAIIFGEYKPPQEIKEIAVDRKILELYAGEYQFAPGRTVIIAVEIDKLTMQSTGRPKRELVPVSETRFVVKTNNEVSVTFERDTGGRVTGLVVNEIASKTPAQKIK